MFSSDTTRNSCGIDSSSRPSRTMETIAETTMNNAFRMLLVAMTRARSFSAVRDRLEVHTSQLPSLMPISFDVFFFQKIPCFFTLLTVFLLYYVSSVLLCILLLLLL